MALGRNASLAVKGGTQMTHHTYKKAPGACNTEGFDTDTTNDLNFATGTRRSKAEAKLLVRLALGGHMVHKGQSGDYLVSKYGLSRHCEDLDDLRDFARQLGVFK